MYSRGWVPAGVMLRQGLHSWTQIFLIQGLLKLGAAQEYGSGHFYFQLYWGYVPSTLRILIVACSHTFHKSLREYDRGIRTFRNLWNYGCTPAVAPLAGNKKNRELVMKHYFDEQSGFIINIFQYRCVMRICGSANKKMYCNVVTPLIYSVCSVHFSVG